MKTAILAAALTMSAWLPAGAQETPKTRQRVQKILQLKYLDPRAIGDLLRVFNCGAIPNENLKLISLDCFADVMPAVEDAIKRYDVPSKEQSDIELTAYFLVATDQSSAEGTAPVPAELDSVVKQIRSVFAFKNFYLLDTLLLRMGGGQPGEVSGQLNNPTFQAPRLTRFSVGRWSARSGDKGDVISLERVKAGLRNPVKKGDENTYVDTGVDLNQVVVPLGQKVVLGKSSLAGAGTALIVVLTARVP